LIKGGHGSGPESVDLLLDKSSIVACGAALQRAIPTAPAAPLSSATLRSLERTLDAVQAAKGLSPLPSVLLIAFPSAMGTVRCITFNNGGECAEFETSYEEIYAAKSDRGRNAGAA
jgi:hypothetical protein